MFTSKLLCRNILLIFIFFALSYTPAYAATCDPSKFDAAKNHAINTTNSCPGGNGTCKNGTDPACPTGECQNGDVTSLVTMGTETRTAWCWPLRTTTGTLACGATCDPNANQCGGSCSDCKNPGTGYICVAPPASATSVGAVTLPICSDLNSAGTCTKVDSSIGVLDTNINGLITRIIQITLGLSGGIFLLLTIRAGYRMISSQGNPEAIKDARESLTSAIVGFIFLIFSFVILELIGIHLLHLPGLS